MAGNLYINLLDEGIYLEGATRILAGQVPYRDFFVLTGPGNFLLTATLFQVLGVTLSTARLLSIAELTAITVCLYFITARFTARPFSVVVSLAYLGLLASNIDTLVVNHRLDSAAFAAIAVTFALYDFPLAAGVAVAIAAWSTPPMLILVIPLAAFLRPHWRRFFTGIAALSAPILAWLTATGALFPMIHHLLWSGANYAAANRSTYGAITGGWAALFSDATSSELLVRSIFIGYCLLLPAILPILVFTAALFKSYNSKEQIFLVAATAAMLLSSYPRPNITNLRYLLPLSFALAAILLYRFRYWKIPTGIISFLTAILLLYGATNITKGELIATPRGPVRFPQETASSIKTLLQHVRPGDTLFVFPYDPITTFLTGAVNPTRYAFLQPGMMTSQDEAAALADLQARPPQWIVYSNIPPQAYLRIWPTSDPTRLRMTTIESYISNTYTQTTATLDPTRHLLRRP